MDNVYLKTPILWAQIDANQHLRHSAYADFAAQARLALLESIGLDLHKLTELRLGPVLFREELRYLKEIRPGDEVRVCVLQTKSSRGGSRFSFYHEIYRQDDVCCAEIRVDGAWIHLDERRLAPIPDELLPILKKIPKSDDFEED